jgi:predicted PhzF superfamily epimerase YddE/YHI9
MWLCVYEDASSVQALRPDPAQLAALDRSVCVTAAGGAFGCDFVSRYFAARAGGAEFPSPAPPTAS